MARATLKDVAAKAGVSYQTVSKVLNGHGQVTVETKARIWQAVETLKYEPNIAARNLRRQGSNLIGFAWSARQYSAWQPILDRFLYRIIERVETEGYQLLFFNDKEPANYADTRTFTELYSSKQVAGFIIANTVKDDSRVAFLMHHKIPFTAFGRANDEWDFCWVDVDGFAGIRNMVAHLIERGHKKIAYIGWNSPIYTGQHRENGYQVGLQEAGLSWNPCWFLQGADTAQTGAEGVKYFLSPPAHQRPTAVVCASDLVAVGALNAATDVGLKVGQDIAITGYDNVPMTELLNPPLTTALQPIRQVGGHVIDLLLRQLSGETIRQKSVLLEPELVIRESS